MTDAPPTPAPDELTAFFWEGCRAGRLLILRCRDCGTYVHWPRPMCPGCMGASLAPDEVSGRGTLYTWTLAAQPFHPWFVDKVPYLVAQIALEEHPNLRMISNLVDCDEADLRIDMPVHVVFREIGPDLVLPMFAPGEA